MPHIGIEVNEFRCLLIFFWVCWALWVDMVDIGEAMQKAGRWSDRTLWIILGVLVLLNGLLANAPVR